MAIRGPIPVPGLVINRYANTLAADPEFAGLQASSVEDRWEWPDRPAVVAPTRTVMWPRGSVPPVELDDGWMAEAACRGCDPELFFPARGDSTATVAPRAVCAGCPVRGECLAYSLAIGAKHGIWGGLSEHERRKVRRRRGLAPRNRSA